MKNTVRLLLSFLLVFGLASSAQAYVIFNDWTLNLDAITDAHDPVINAALDGEINDINQIAYNGIAWGRTLDTNGNGVPDVGEIGRTDGLLSSITYLDKNGAQQFMKDSDTFFELTFDFSLNSVQTTQATATTAGVFYHLAGGSNPTGTAFDSDGILDIYIDITPDAAQVTGDGYTDGLKIASFIVKAGFGGTFLPATGDGSDDGTFELVSAIDGIFLDADDNDLTDNIGKDNVATIAITDSNFDADPDNNGVFDSVFGTNVFSPPNPQTPINFVANEDGSASLGVQIVPEPTTMVLFGIGLLGLAGVGRRRRA